MISSVAWPSDPGIIFGLLSINKKWFLVAGTAYRNRDPHLVRVLFIFWPWAWSAAPSFMTADAAIF